MTTTLTVTKRGEVTLDKELLDHLGVRPGESLAVKLDPHGQVSLSAARPEKGPGANPTQGRIEDTFGMLGHLADGPAPTIEELEEIAAEGWASRR